MSQTGIKFLLPLLAFTCEDLTATPLFLPIPIWDKLILLTHDEVSRWSVPYEQNVDGLPGSWELSGLPSRGLDWPKVK